MEYLKSERKQILYSILLGLAGGLVGIALFGLSGYMISLSFFDPPFFVIILIIAVIKLFGMMKGAFRYIERLLSHEATFKLIGRLRLNYFKSTISSEQNTHSVKFIQKLNQYFEQVENYYIRIIYPYIVAVLISLLLMVLAVYAGLGFAAMTAIIALILLFAIPKLFEGRMSGTLESRDQTDDALYARLYHYIHDYTNLWVTGKKESEKEKIAPGIRRIRENENRMATNESLMQFMAQGVQLSAIIMIIVMLYEQTPLWVPMIMLIALSYFDLAMPVMNPASQYRTVKAAVSELELDIAHTSIPDMPSEVSAIEVDHLDFRYPNASLDVLKDVSLTVKEGEKHVIIGSSGSGKTTLIDRIIDGDKAVTLYDESGRTVPGASIAQASVMPQQLDFYNASVMDNITMFGHIERNRTAVESDLELLEMAHYTPDTMIEFTGRLSGGEQKRLQFIRMLAENKSWWIMDEPTARLDDRLKQKIWDHILSRPTLIVSTHDLSRLESFDHIHYMEQGRIIESGTYEQLMQRHGPVYQAVQRFRDFL
ncbi:ATP-binding cassette domain-containing protein [Salinicoccus hispanicus]|uniref:ATP-binding cassette domain-containing protein n=1 Tax=Salinicoccus hispanicus TaxID=157225 RepID=A0A6N8U2T0_9STAP|nr:ATP-binding cassette domain-containing protein [Salinicoccus hispanicus]MXQ50695.1 ATP-binding cassette domain-containing protein [Salinicoccus hispanicus]